MNQGHFTKVFIHAQDLASAIIGPFDSEEDAEEHIAFCIKRGDGAQHWLVGEDDLQKIREDWHPLELTPEEDKTTAYCVCGKDFNPLTDQPCHVAPDQDVRNL